MALKWVSLFIEYFGGDPKQITVAGEASVSYLILNKEAQPLIYRAIIRYTTFISEYNRPYEAPGFGHYLDHVFDDELQAELNVLLIEYINGTEVPIDIRHDRAAHLLRFIYHNEKTVFSLLLQ